MTNRNRSGCGLCRAPNCHRTRNLNSYSIYCKACYTQDLRYGAPNQTRLKSKELAKPLAEVARIRRGNPQADWWAMAANWNALGVEGGGKVGQWSGTVLAS
jgi:hypothetical protein